MKRRFWLFFLTIIPTLFIAQNNTTYWQQKVDYSMDIDIDVKNFTYNGNQTLVYTNNSPDELNVVYYHLYWNAFQPGSMMDQRLKQIEDGDKRMLKNGVSKIDRLDEKHIGYQKVKVLKQDGVNVSYNIIGTIMKVQLNQPIGPGTSSTFTMEWEAQVPNQVRRSGRQSDEGIALSMTQWYPKMAEYDYEGWHADQYIAREFHGVFGNYDVKLHIDKNYTIGGTGVLQNANEVGHGYSPGEGTPNNGKITYHFKAENVHDFAFGADNEYEHKSVQVPNGPILRFFYKKNKPYSATWEEMIPYAEKFFPYMEKYFGKYPYPEYAIVQGGDGGMEYAMCTLITGDRKLPSLVGVTFHEGAHSWFQHVLATNETEHAWMDEGFTTFASDEAMNELFSKEQKPNPHQSSYDGYNYLVKSGKQEPLTTLSDYFDTNMAYSIASYSMGAIFLNQLSYIIGQTAFEQTMLDYFNTWKFKHPTPNDFKRVAEKNSGIELKWYVKNWIGTTKHIDYAIGDIKENAGQTDIQIMNKGNFGMPLDILVTYTDGTQELYYIPLISMYSKKLAEYKNIPRVELDPMAWTARDYTFKIKRAKKDISAIYIDPSFRLADIDVNNNIYNAK